MITIEHVRKLDEKDPLTQYRKAFYIPHNTIYMDGNSLGLMSENAEKEVLRVLSEWKSLAIDGWLSAKEPWFYYAEKIGAMAAKLVGADKNEVIATAGITHNIHSALASFYQPQGKRKKILADALTFPSDIYAIKQFLKLKGENPDECLVMINGDSNGILNEQEIIQNFNDEIALVFLPTVLYRSGQLLDVELLTTEAHKHNIIIGFDAAHSAGVIPHRFHDCEVDFAVWCGYKYMNGGPGSTGFLFIHEKHFDKEPLLAGWFGYQKEKQFDMSYDFVHQRAASGWQISTPDILSLAALHGAIGLSLEAGINKIREKSIKLTDLLYQLIQQKLTQYGFKIQSQDNSKKRGGHIALVHKTEAWRIALALKSENIVPDFRHPDIIRLAPVALYNTYEEVYVLVERIINIMENEKYLLFDKNIKSVS